MTEFNNTVTEHVDAVQFKRITLKSELISTPIEITDIVTHLDIYEHIENPYLTATIAIDNSQDIISTFYINGSEKITIEIQSSKVDTKAISKTFYIDKIISSNKTSETGEFVVLHLLEDIAYESSLQNVNKSYSGTPVEILKKISKEFLDNKDIKPEKSEESTDSKKIKVIIPNLTPLDSMMWIRNRACTSNGYPFYLVSTLVDKELQFVDLETLMKSATLNKIPFIYGETIMDKSESFEVRHRNVILDYNVKGTENLLSLVRKGLIGAEYQFIDPTENKQNKFSFDVQKDVLDSMSKNFPKINEAPPYVDKLKFSEKNSRVIARVGSTRAYDEDNKSYMEDDGKGKYKLNVISSSIDNMIKNNPMHIVVNGIDFLDGNAHYTIGRKIAIRFLRNAPAEEVDYHFDNKKSGDFFIFSAKHSISGGEYALSLSCVKLDNSDVQ